MRRLIAIAALSLGAVFPARGDGLDARALLGYERYDTNNVTRTGVRQTYDLHLDRALTGNSHLSVFFRANEFHGNSSLGGLTQKSTTRELRPGGELTFDTSNVSGLVRSERFDTRQVEGIGSDRRLERSTAALSWSPTGLPLMSATADRNSTSGTNIQQVDDNVGVGAQWGWRGLSASAQQNLLRSTDQVAGYDRRSFLGTYALNYSQSNLGGRLTTSVDSNVRRMNIDETGTESTLIPIAVTVARALWAVDDTPLDSRDHPPLQYAALNDGVLNVSSGLSLGPDAPSFQNFILDIGHVETVDEVRIYVRDATNAPLRNGGGNVTWDAYTSQDGNVWTPLNSTTSFNDAFSAYSVAIAPLDVRWLKLVNFSANAEATFITELQAYRHSSLAAGQHRRGAQKLFNGSANVGYRPTQKLSLNYSAIYSSLDQSSTGQALSSTRDIEHMANLGYDFTRSLGVRFQLLRRSVSDTLTAGDQASEWTGYLDYNPTAKLRLSLESGHQDETLDGSGSSIDTHAFHATGYLLRSVQLTLDAGTQTQSIRADSSTAYRTFANLSANVLWTRTFRMQLTGTLQRTRTDSTDPVVQLLGPSRDNRVAADFIWRPSRELAVSTRFGWVSGVALSTFTQRYHVDWFPFEGGTVSLGGSYDEDIDATTNRRARRAVFNPRWQMNRFVIFDLNYTMVTTQLETQSSRQRTLFASVTLIK